MVLLASLCLHEHDYHENVYLSLYVGALDYSIGANDVEVTQIKVVFFVNE